jgi:hypothetical protein
VDRFDDRLRRRGEKAVDLMRAGNRFRFRPAVALELGPDASKAGQRSVVIDREPDDVLLFGLGVRLGCVFSEAVEWHQAAVFRLQPAAPVRRIQSVRQTLATNQPLSRAMLPTARPEI